MWPSNQSVLCGLRKHPGSCDQPAACELHHVKYKAHSGKTSLITAALELVRAQGQAR
jgi:hypothetical protein